VGQAQPFIFPLVSIAEGGQKGRVTVFSSVSRKAKRRKFCRDSRTEFEPLLNFITAFEKIQEVTKDLDNYPLILDQKNENRIDFVI